MDARRALLVTYPDPFVKREALELARAAGYDVITTITQRRLGISKYGLGSGKAQELKDTVKELEIDVILVDERLKSVQIYNLARLTGVEVMDREQLILQIFTLRASSAEAKLQVELAKLRYEMPRAREKVRLAKMGEQPGFYGLGGYEVEVYYREIKRRMSHLMEKLKELRSRRELHRARRRQLGLPIISLAGYTGAGKTTLFNRLTGADKEMGAGVFTTLATSTRSFFINGTKLLLSDTVGFISRLPPYMIEAFKATLEELSLATLVVLVMDASEPLEHLRLKHDTCRRILSELGVAGEKIMVVMNKADLLSDGELASKVEALGLEDCPSISALKGWGIEGLLSRVEERVLRTEAWSFHLTGEEAIALAKELDWLKAHASVSLTKADDGSLGIKAKGPSWALERFRTVLAH